MTSERWKGFIERLPTVVKKERQRKLISYRRMGPIVG